MRHRTSLSPAMIERSSAEPIEINKHIGQRIRMWRVLSGISLSEIAKGAGVSPQQIKKYETGESRVGAATLYAIADRLHLSVGQFFEEHSPSSIERPKAARKKRAHVATCVEEELVEDIMRLSPRMRGRLAVLVHRLLKDERETTA